MPIRTFIFQLGVVLQMSWRATMARKSSWFGFLIFGLCLLILFPFSFGTDLIKQDEIRTGAFWMTQEFVVALLVLRVFSAESEQGALELLLNPGFSRSALLFGKIVFTMGQLLSLQIPLFFVWWALYEIPWDSTRMLLQNLVPVVLLFNAGTSALGVLLNALTSRSLARELLVPVLFFPMQVSILLPAVQLTILDPLLLPKGGWTDAAWWTLLLSFPLVFGSTALSLGRILFEE